MTFGLLISGQFSFPLPTHRTHEGCHLDVTGQVHQDKGGWRFPQEAEDDCPEEKVRSDGHLLQLVWGFGLFINDLRIESGWFGPQHCTWSISILLWHWIIWLLTFFDKFFAHYNSRFLAWRSNRPGWAQNKNCSCTIYHVSEYIPGPSLTLGDVTAWVWCDVAPSWMHSPPSAIGACARTILVWKVSWSTMAT